MKKTLYQILEVASSARQETIDAAYDLVGQRLHPDNNPFDPDAVNKHHMVKDAYRILSDPVTRARYDASLSAAANPSPVIVTSVAAHDEESAGWKKPAILATAALLAGWLYLNHSHKVERERIEAERVAAEHKARIAADEEVEKERLALRAAESAEIRRLQAEREQRAEFERFRRDADANSRRVEAEEARYRAEQTRQQAEKERRARSETQESERRARAEVQDLQRKAREAEYRILYGR